VSSDVVNAPPRTMSLDTTHPSTISHIFLLGILIFKGLTAQRLYKSFGVKGLIISL
jgi:hypothetical protein